MRLIPKPIRVLLSSAIEAAALRLGFLREEPYVFVQGVYKPNVDYSPETFRNILDSKTGPLNAKRETDSIIFVMHTRLVPWLARIRWSLSFFGKKIEHFQSRDPEKEITFEYHFTLDSGNAPQAKVFIGGEDLFEDLKVCSGTVMISLYAPQFRVLSGMLDAHRGGGMTKMDLSTNLVTTMSINFTNPHDALLYKMAKAY